MASISIKRINILIVDDSGVMRRIHKNILIECGVEESDIIEAEDGKFALYYSMAKPIITSPPKPPATTSWRRFRLASPTT